MKYFDPNILDLCTHESKESSASAEFTEKKWLIDIAA